MEERKTEWKLSIGFETMSSREQFIEELGDVLVGFRQFSLVFRQLHRCTDYTTSDTSTSIAKRSSGDGEGHSQICTEHLPCCFAIGKATLSTIVSHGMENHRSIGDRECGIVEIDDHINDLHDDNSIVIGC